MQLDEELLTFLYKEQIAAATTGSPIEVAPPHRTHSSREHLKNQEMLVVIVSARVRTSTQQDPCIKPLSCLTRVSESPRKIPWEDRSQMPLEA